MGKVFGKTFTQEYIKIASEPMKSWSTFIIMELQIRNTMLCHF